MKAFTLIIISLLITNIVFAQDPGDLNTAFGTGGAFTGAWSDTMTQANDIGIQWNGHFIVSGQLMTIDPVEEQIFVVELRMLPSG